MATKDPRVDAYIDRAQPFAKPILRHVRKLVHQAVPGVEETIKWSFPHFEYKGMLCSIAAFKAHCAMKAAALNEAGIKSKREVRPPKPPLDPPQFLIAALERNRRARSAFERFPPSHRREYIEWLTDAKTDATRQRRLGTAIQWIAEGEGRNWKYER